MNATCFLKFAAHLFIFLMCSCQICYISLKYYTYLVTTSASYETNEIITKIPSITMCSGDFLRSPLGYEIRNEVKVYGPNKMEPEIFIRYNNSLPLCINKDWSNCADECAKKMKIESAGLDFMCTFNYRGFLPHELITNVTLDTRLKLKGQLSLDVFFWSGKFCYTINNNIQALNRSLVNNIWDLQLILDSVFLLIQKFQTLKSSKN